MQYKVTSATLFTSKGKHFAGEVVSIPKAEADAINKIAERLEPIRKKKVEK